MFGPQHIILSVQYDQQPAYGRSLEWIAPELTGARMTMTEDRVSEPKPSRTWEGTVDAQTFERFARAWNLPEDNSDEAEPPATSSQHPAPWQYTLDGMNWEEGGESPIVCATVQVTFAPRPRHTE